MSIEHSCVNVNDNTFFNKCRRELPPGFLSAMGETITVWLSPIVNSIQVTIIILALPYILLQVSILKDQVVKRINLAVIYKRTFLILLNLLHRINYTLALNVALYTIFRQDRPCRCTDMKYSKYGMPSGDSMLGGIMGFSVIWYKPFGTYKSIIVGIILMILKCLERTVLGYHSIGQVTSGVTLGILLSLYQLNVPQVMIFFDIFVILVLGCIFIPLDHSLTFPPFDGFNLMTWYIWGLGLCIWIGILVARIYYKQNYKGLYSKLSVSLQSINVHTLHLSHSDEDFRSSDNLHLLMEEETTLDEFVDILSDKKFVFITWLLVFMLVGYISYLFQVYGWGY